LCNFLQIKTRYSATVECLDYQIPVTQLTNFQIKLHCIFFAAAPPSWRHLAFGIGTTYIAMPLSYINFLNNIAIVMIIEM